MLVHHIMLRLYTYTTTIKVFQIDTEGTMSHNNMGNDITITIELLYPIYENYIHDELPMSLSIYDDDDDGDKTRLVIGINTGFIWTSQRYT